MGKNILQACKRPTQWDTPVKVSTSTINQKDIFLVTLTIWQNRITSKRSFRPRQWWQSINKSIRCARSTTTVVSKSGTVKPRGVSNPLRNRERWEDDGIFFHFSGNRAAAAWIITEITNPLSTRLRFAVEIRGFYEPSLLKLQVLQEQRRAKLWRFPEITFREIQFFSFFSLSLSLPRSSRSSLSRSLPLSFHDSFSN